MVTQENSVLVDYSRNQNYSALEIDAILCKFREHEKRAVRESIFDSIGSGSLNRKVFVEECQHVSR